MYIINGKSRPATNTAASVVFAAVSGKVISGIRCLFSYSGGTPTGGRLTVSSNAVTILDIDVPAAGCFDFDLDGFSGAVSQDYTVTLAAAGASIQGALSVSARY